MGRGAVGVLAVIAGQGLWTGHAAAQTDTLLVAPVLPEDFDRGRNVSVTQRARPDYDAVGVSVGSFDVFPQVAVAGGYSDNIYYRGTDVIGDGFVTLAPSVEARSDWSRDAVRLRAGLQADRYLSNSARNQTSWYAGGVGTVELGDSIKVIPEVQAAKRYETPFTSDLSSSAVVLSSYHQYFGSLRGEYEQGQAKLTLAVDDTKLDFGAIDLPATVTGLFVDQDGRDRNITRVVGQAQYAFTPSVATYAQLTYSNIDYDRQLAGGIDNRDSTGFQLIGGFNFDLSGLLRGTLGLGYTRRTFDSPLYPTVGGFSAQAKVEWFPTELTTVTVEAGRVLTDASISSVSAYFDNRVSLRVDHEILVNLLGYALGQYSRQDYSGVDFAVSNYRLGVGANYLVSPGLSLNTDVLYTGRSTDQSTFLGQNFHAFQISLGAVLKR